MEDYHLPAFDARHQCADLSTSPGCLSGHARIAGWPDEQPANSSEMTSSVTRHIQIAVKEIIQFLICGIDTLDVGVYVRWNDWEQQLSFFEKMKQASQGTDGILCKTDQGRGYLFLPTGKPPQYRFHPQFLEYNAYIAKSEEYINTPNVYVSFSSCAIWHLGIPALIDLLESDLASFGAEIIRIVPSRVDICADFKAYSPITKQFLDTHRVSRSQIIETHENGGKLESSYCGAKKAEVRATIYDNDLEIGKNDKQWFLSIWGIEDSTDVFRLEFRMRRPFLHKYQINSLDDLQQKLGSIWGYLTSEWFSLRLPDNPETDRRTIHPWWVVIQQQGAEMFGKDEGMRREYNSDSMVSIEKILPHIIGRNITIAALSGINDRKRAIHNLAELLEKHSDDTTFKEKFRKKSVKIGYRGKLGEVQI